MAKKTYELAELLANVKVENEGTSTSGKLSADEWNSLVTHVWNNKNAVDNIVSIRGIKYNGGVENGGQTFSEIDNEGYLKMTIADASGYQLAVNVTETPAPYIAKGAYCPISLNVSHKKVEGNGTVPATRPCIVNLYLNDSTKPFYTANVYDKDSTEPGALKQLTVDLSKIDGLDFKANEAENEIKIEVNNREGTVKNEYCIVRVVELGLFVDRFDIKNVYHENDKPQLLARVSGSDAFVTATVDGIEILKNGPTMNGVDTNFGQDIFTNVNKHGVHTLEVYASVIRKVSSTVEGETERDLVISTPAQKFNYIYGTASENPVVMSVIKNTEPEEYNNFEMSYVAYKYNSTAVAVTDTVNVSLCEAIYNNEGKLNAGNRLITVSQEVTFDVVTNSAKGNVMFSLFPVNNVSLVGKKAILITIGTYSQVSEIEIKPSTVALNQQGGYAVYLTANNRSNNEPADTVRTWKSIGTDKAGNQLIVNADFDDNIEFINTGSGWIADSDGNMAMHLRKGRYFTLNYQPFNDNPTYNDETNQGTGRGKTISIEFATRNCLNQNSPVISCLDSSNGTERGFEITASKAVLKANTFALSADFKEETRIRIDFVIEGKKTSYSYDTVSGKDGKVYKGTSDEALAIIYVDGVYQCLKVIPTSTTFRQGNSQNPASSIRFGSADCDLDIYNIRIYNQALTPAQIVNNYSYDTPKFNDKIEIAKRNDIFDSTSLSNKPNINMGKLRDARPDLPFFIIKEKINENTGTDAILPQTKDTWQKLQFSEWKNPKNELDPAEAAISWKTEFGRWRNQGTSSMSYPWPWRNWDWQLKDGDFTFGNNTTGSKWAQYKGMSDAGSIKKITLKKDYASSEMCNNAITSEYFTDMALAIGGDYPNVLSPAQRIHGADMTPFRLTFVATPCFLFQQFNDPAKPGSAGAGYEALGMMNLIPNKNECEHLGFGDKSGYKWKPSENLRAQSWELADNMDDWFWYKKLEGIKRNSNGTYTNDLASCYEARYPKDSTLNDSIWDIIDETTNKREESDFGMVVKDKATISEEQKSALADEQKDIIEFHNWLVDVNRQVAIDYYNEHDGNYRELTYTEREWEWNKDENGAYNKYDTPEYRLNKFKAEAPTRLIIDQFCLYYIWRETFWAFDSGFKNLQVYTMGKANENAAYMQWGCMVRDADTTLGIENTGKKIFPAHIEDTDFYKKDDQGNITFEYNGAKGLYHNKSISALGGHAVLNGQLGSLWVNLRDVYGSRIAEIYRALSNASKANWNSDLAINRFRKHQEKWCESLYNFGMRQYFGGEPFTTWIDSGLGDKKNSRASWLDRGFYYRNSKYNNLTDYCAGRIVCYHTPDLEGEHTENHPLQFKSYIPMYVGLGAHEQSMTACKKTIRVTDIENTFLVMPGSNGLDFAHEEGDDTVTWFFGTDQLTELGDLARCCKVKTWQAINLPKLRELNLGHEKDRDGIEYKEYVSVVTQVPSVDENGNPTNNNTTEITKDIRPFTNQYLESMDCSSLKQLTLLDITNHTMLKTLNLTACDQLQKLYARGTNALTGIDLPATTALDTIYLGKNLVTLNLDKLTSITKFELEGASKIERLYIKNCGTYMAGRSYDIMKMAITSLESHYDAETNNNICILEGIDWTGTKSAEVQYIEKLLNINATLSGKINITGNLNNDLKVRLVNKYGNIDDITNGLYITYTQTEIKSAKMPNKLYIYTPGEHQLAFSVNPISANTYKSAVWSLATNDFATINPTNGLLIRNNEVADINDSAELTVTIKQLPYSNGKERADIVLTSIIYFYERTARIGDIVFNDGTFSDELDDTKSPIGVCFYIDPDNKENRLMCALNPISGNLITWGVRKGFDYTSNGKQLYYGTSSKLNISDNTYDCYDIKTISNITQSGFVSKPTNMFTDNVYRDATNYTDNFRIFDKMSLVGNIGWIEANNNIIVDELVLPNGQTELNINKYEMVPAGYYNTLAIIQHRNKLLDAYKNTKGQEDAFIRPYSTNTYTEFNIINTLLNEAEQWAYEDRSRDIINDDTGGSTLYFPAASLCFAYEPVGVTNLADKFKKYNWFLPTSGELIRILYYIYHIYNGRTSSDYNDAYSFENAVAGNIITINNFIGKTYWSSTETSSDTYAASIQLTSSDNKYNDTADRVNNCSIIPICKF